MCLAAGVVFGMFGDKTANCIALEAGDFAWTELATTSLDQMREFTCGVIAIALVAAIKAGFVGKLVGGRNRVSNTLPFFNN
ncbi:hypothetical protein AAKU64_003077 [Undibacterium sp. GrIS 1.8]|uniref:hypothetical protein n=1 Tax=Undibacterium sp. GrIS 1.8 TaxID=3143934 RepID=UPI00339557E0